MAPRRSTDPKRRLAPANSLDQAGRDELADRLIYTGSALHKRKPGDYGFHPAVNPRPSKSLCDGKRVVLKAQAQHLLRSGVRYGLFSLPGGDGRPKYVWAVDDDGEVYEAKIDSFGYHGYRLEEEDDFRHLVLKEWARRCSLN